MPLNIEHRAVARAIPAGLKTVPVQVASHMGAASRVQVQASCIVTVGIIGQIRSENAVFLFTDAGSPTLVREDGDAKALYVLMPMRV